MAAELRDETVGLFVPDEDGEMTVFCTGVWVSDTEILTAGHCSEHAQSEGKYPEAVGSLVWYSTASEAGDPGQTPKATHLAVVVLHDHTHDLSLLKVRSVAPMHMHAHVADESPAQGAHLSFMGQPSGLYWTYFEGYLAAYRKELPVDFSGPFMQVSAPVFFGSSGGGAFDSNGNLVGIASFMMTRTPNCAFYIPVVSIKNFLSHYHAK
jgi:S1-C subfamily serine protease